MRRRREAALADPVIGPLLADPRRALRSSALLLGGGILVCLLVWSTAARDVIQHVDDAFLDLAEATRWTPIVQLAKALAFLGGALCTWIIRTFVVVVLVKRRHWLHLSAFVLAVVSSELLIGPLKGLYDRPRPIGSLVGTSSSSFPSGHAVAAGVTAVGLVIVLLHPGHKRWVWERQAAIYASVMALSRTYLGAHWLSDVIAGGLLGSGLAIAWPALLVGLRVRRAVVHGEPPLRTSDLE